MSTSVDLDKIKKMRILVVGDLMLDRYLWGDVERISPEAPVPVFHIRKRSDMPGGAGNVVSNLVGLGSSVTVVGLIGNDVSGELLKMLLQKTNVSTHVITDFCRSTITKTRVVSQGHQLVRIDEEDNLCASIKIKNRIKGLIEESISACNAIILSDYGKGLLQTKNLCQDIIRLAKERDIPVIIDPKGKDWERYREASCVTPNLKELELVYGEKITDKKQLVQAMRYIMTKYSLGYLVVTRGPLGLCLMDQSQTPVFIPALARNVYDVSGAGDTVIATLAGGVGSGHTFLDSAKVANLAASIVVGKIGTQPINLLELKASLEINGLDACTNYTTHKIASLTAATLQVDAWKANRQKIVFTNGCFDLLHPGHIHLLRQAKDLGDWLVVAVNSDVSVKRLKGPSRPILAENDRASLLASLSFVDLVLIFNEDTPEEILHHLKPHILVKGADYKLQEIVGRSIVEAYGGRVQTLKLLSGYSTTAITNKVRAASNRYEKESLPLYL